MAPFRSRSSRSSSPHLRTLGLLAAFTLAPLAARAQDAPVRVELPPQETGAVVNASVSVPAAFAGADTLLAFTLTPADGVRLFGARTGALRTRAGEGARLSFTGALSRTQEAGPLVLARVAVTNAAGAVWQADVVTTVRARHRVALALRAEPATIAPGGRTRLVLQVRNAGNTADTLALAWDVSGGWLLRAAPATLVVPPAATLDTTVLLQADGAAAVGDARAISLLATSRAGVLRATAVVQVTPYGGLGQDHVQVPTTLFAGTGTGLTGAMGFVGALTMAGAPFRDTRVQLTARSNAAGVWSPAFVDDVAGPRVQISVARPTWRATGGDVGLTSAGLLGGTLRGQGLTADLTRGDVQGTAFAAATRGNALVPALYQGLAQARTTTRFGTVGAVATGLVRGAGALGDGLGVQALGGRYVLPAHPDHQLKADVGLLHLSTAGTHTFGPVLDVAYGYTHQRTALNAHVRQVPGALPSGELLPSELFVGGMTGLTRRTSVQGWATSSRLDLPGGGGFRNRAAAFGPAWMHGGARASLTGTVQQAASTDVATAATGRATVTAAGGLPLGAFNVEASAEVGRRTVGIEARPLRVVRGGVRWSRHESWLALSLSRYVGEAVQPLTFAALNGTLTHGRAEVRFGGAAALQTGAAARWNGWLSTTVAVSPAFAVVAGVEAEPGAAAPVRVSLGLRRRFALPLPLAPPTLAQGLVFEDSDGNGVQDPGEDGLAGVHLRVGPASVVTDAAGRWALRDGVLEPTTTAEPDALTLPSGLLPLATRRDGARFWTPVARTAGLALALFADENANGTRDAGEPAAQNVTVALTDAQGQVRYAPLDAAGIARLTGLASGAYTLVLSTAVEGGAPREHTEALTLAPGEVLERAQAAPSAQRTIRFTRNG